MSSISSGTVYKIVCTLDNSIVYIGSTFNELRHRWQQHKNSYKKYLNGKFPYMSIYPYFEKFGIENFKIFKIKDYKCYREHNKDSKHLHVYEQLWINKTKGCVNNRSAFMIPIVFKEYQKEYNKEYRETNKEKIKEKRKEYTETNKDKIKQKQKEYREANKDKIKQYQKEYREANKDKISQHRKKYYETNKDKQKEYTETNKDKIKQYQKEWQETNKDKNKEKRKEYRETNREKIKEKGKERINCKICNQELARWSLTVHNKRFHSS